MKLYDQVQALRDQANKPDDVGHPTPAQLQQSVELLRQALGYLDASDPELAYGNGFLASRRSDVNADLARVYAELGDKQKALDCIDAVLAVSWMPFYADEFRSTPAFASLEDEPRFQADLAKLDLAKRLMTDTAIATPYVPELPEDQRLAGLALFWAQARYGFVHFGNVPDLDWDRTFMDYMPKVQAAKTTRDYYEVMMRLAASLHDGHTNVYPPKELADSFYARPPLRTGLVDGHVLVLKVASPTLEKMGIKVGDEVTTVDGMDVKRYADSHVAPYESSSTPQDLEVRSYTYALLAGDKDRPVHLGLRDATGHQMELQVPRSGYTDIQPTRPFVVKDLPGGIVYLHLDHFESDAGVKAFEQALPQIMHAHGLILDMRDNGGGSTYYGTQILMHLTRGPIPEAHSVFADASPYEQTRNPTIIWHPFPDVPGEASTQDIYAGPVVVLIGPRTFSAGEDFVMAFDAMHRGTLIGEATGGSTGQPLMFKLPGGGMARICVKWDAYPDGKQFVGVGIQPAIVVKPTVADVRAGRDPVLDRALAELSKL